MNNKKIFSGVSLLVNPGEKILIEASSGWGKSTLFNILIGNYHASEGTYSINGQDVNS
ncbi:ATP-binding cassette domain-containing protein, partial [Oenococcus oeni]